MSVNPELQRSLSANRDYAAAFDAGDVPAAPSRHVAVITCMDTRIDPDAALGLRLGDAHVIRNAGGLATDDAIRSVVISQQLLGTNQVWLIQHTECGLLKVADQELRDRLRAETGSDAELAFLTFTNLEESVRDNVERLRRHPWVRRDTVVVGLIYDVSSGRLREIEPAD